VSLGPAGDVTYVRGFYKELSPTLLRAAAAMNGVAPPPAEDFDYCELGCGNGDTLVALAAAYPRARFVGVDLSAEHIAFARALAASAGLTNVRLLEGDFEALPPEALPQLDYVCAHGVWTWIAAAKRRALAAFAAAKLKPGGLLHVSYNAMPGWAAIEPMRRLLLDVSADVEGGPLARARRGIQIAQLLCDGGAEYFARNPATRELLDTAIRAGLPYVVHEYFAEDWQPSYFADVAAQMAEHGLAFVGGLPLYLAVRALVLPASLGKAFEPVTDRLAFESLKDFATNEFFRRDVYVRGPAARSEATWGRYLDATPFTTLVAPDAIKREVRLPHHALQLAGPLFDALVARLAEGQATVRELAADPALAPFGLERVRDGVVQLLLGEQVTPALAGARPLPPAAPSDRARPGIPLAYNRAVLEQRLSNKHPIVLASPAAGTGVVVPPLQAVALRALTMVEPQDRAAWIRAFVEREPLRLLVRERPVVDKAEQAAVVAAEVDSFEARRLPKLIALGIVA